MVSHGKSLRIPAAVPPLARSLRTPAWSCCLQCPAPRLGRAWAQSSAGLLCVSTELPESLFTPSAKCGKSSAIISSNIFHRTFLHNLRISQVRAEQNDTLHLDSLGLVCFLKVTPFGPVEDADACLSVVISGRRGLCTRLQPPEPSVRSGRKGCSGCRPPARSREQPSGPLCRYAPP